MYTITSDMSDKEVRKYSILNRIERLEQSNDRYMANTGMPNTGIYDQIQKLYDELDSIK